jgi:hypothetical protein
MVRRKRDRAGVAELRDERSSQEEELNVKMVGGKAGWSYSAVNKALTKSSWKNVIRKAKMNGFVTKISQLSGHINRMKVCQMRWAGSQ